MDAISPLTVNRPWQVKGDRSKESADSQSGQRWSFASGIKIVLRPQAQNALSFSRDPKRKMKSMVFSASWLPSPEVAFTVGTVAVFPFYSLMVLAPGSKLTKKTMQSNLPYVALGAAYVWLLYCSWTADTARLMFSGKYWLPQLSSITRMFSNELTMASAWLHLLLVDLFAARQIFLEGLEHNLETRHSVSLCLFFCPIGIIAHALTKLLTAEPRASR